MNDFIIKGPVKLERDVAEQQLWADSVRVLDVMI